MKNVVNKNKSIQNRDHDEDDNYDDIKTGVGVVYDIEEGNDKEEKLIVKPQKKKRKESKSPEKGQTISQRRSNANKISDQPPNAEEKMHGLREVLRKVSVGKYYTKLYFNGKDT